MTILGDPGADSGDEEKSKRAEKYMARRKVKNVLYFLRDIYFSARLDFSSSPLSAPGSPRMTHDVLYGNQT